MTNETIEDRKSTAASGRDEPVVMPLQPILEYRFVPNRIVEMLLEKAPVDLNDIAAMEFTQQERVQFAQLIGYSVIGFGSLSYVDDETYGAAIKVCEGATELEARNSELREQLDEVRKGWKIASSAAFRIHPDDLEA